MAMESGALYDVLFSFALGHLAILDSSYKVPAIEARSTAIRHLASSVHNPSNRMSWYESTAAACLAFLASEVGVGDCRGWYAHLKGTQQVILSATTSNPSSSEVLRGAEAFKQSSEGQWILRNFAYHDITGSVILRRKPLLDPVYLDGITDVVDSYLGVATGLLRYVGEVVYLDESTAIDEQLSDDEIRRRVTLMHDASLRIEQQLEDWKCPLETSEELTALAFAYRSMGLIVLYRFMRSRLRNERVIAALSRHGIAYAPNQETNQDLPCNQPGALNVVQAKIRQHLCNILHHLDNLPADSPPESAILFPLFLAGGEATEQCHIDNVRRRMHMTLRKRQFPNIATALGVLEDLWSLRRDHPDAAADWPQILDASSVDLLLT